MKKRINGKELNNTYNASVLTWKQVWSEIQEFIDAVRQGDKNEMKDEWNDIVYSCVSACNSKWITCSQNNTTIQKVMERFQVWHTLFEEQGLVFDKKYLNNGSNYNRPEKVKMALEQAKRDQH